MDSTHRNLDSESSRLENLHFFDYIKYNCKKEMAESREDSIYFARLSEQGERYEDMIKYMKQVAKTG